MPTVEPTTFEEAVHICSEAILESWAWGPDAFGLTHWSLDASIAPLVEYFKMSPGDRVTKNLADVFLALGAGCVDASWNEDIDISPLDVMIKCEDIMARKQHDYGHGNILAFGLLGVIVRLSDKAARLRNLWERGEGTAQVGESLRDTLDDMIGYCIIGLMLLTETFTLPLKADVEPERRPSSPQTPAGWANGFEAYRTVSAMRTHLPA